MDLVLQDVRILHSQGTSMGRCRPRMASLGSNITSGNRSE